MGSDNYYMSAKQSDAPTPTPPPTNAAGGTSKERKKHDRFNGMSEEEVCRRTLPDHLDTNLDVVIVSTVDFQLRAEHSIVLLGLLLVAPNPHPLPIPLLRRWCPTTDTHTRHTRDTQHERAVYVHMTRQCHWPPKFQATVKYRGWTLIAEKLHFHNYLHSLLLQGFTNNY